MKSALYALRAIAAGPLWPLLAVSVTGWFTMFAIAAHPLSARICGTLNRWQALILDWRVFGPLPFLVLFLAMLGGMMGPLLAQNILSVRDQSFVRRRPRATALFLIGYGLPWLAAIAAVWALSLVLVAVLQRDLAALAVAIGIGLVWQGLPLKAIALRRCHLAPVLPAFGARADLASFSYGVRSSAWCIAACWAWMLMPFTYAAAHLALMLLVFLIVLSERYARPPPVRARPKLIGIGLAIVIAALGLSNL